MPDENRIPTHEEIAQARSMFTTLMPWYPEILEGQRKDAEAAAEAAENMARRHNEKVMRRVTFASVAVALVASLAAVWSGLEAHWTRLGDQRPFISAEVVDSSDWIVLHSVGKSPAIRIRSTCYIVADQAQIDWKHVSDTPSRDALWFLAGLVPGQNDAALCKRTTSEGRHEVRYGLVTYQDSQSHKYQTPFCYGLFRNETEAEVQVQVHACFGNGNGQPELK